MRAVGKRAVMRKGRDGVVGQAKPCTLGHSAIEDLVHRLNMTALSSNVMKLQTCERQPKEHQSRDRVSLLMHQRQHIIAGVSFSVFGGYLRYGKEG